MLSSEQKNRIASYRRQRPAPESASDTQVNKPENFVGQSHPVPTIAPGQLQPGAAVGTPVRNFPGNAAPSPAVGAQQPQFTAGAAGTPKALQNYNQSASRQPSPIGGGSAFNKYALDLLQQGDPAAVVRPANLPAGLGAPPVAPRGLAGGGSIPQSSNPSAYHPQNGAGIGQTGGLQNVPGDLANYILQLESQNQELRAALSHAQHQLASGVGGGGGAGAALGGGGAAPTPSNMLREYGEDEKKMFLNDVLSQVETVIQAHKNKTAAEIQKYKTEAENATLALRNLRNAVQQEGMDLAMAPAMISLQRSAGSGGAAGKSASAAEAVARAKAQGLDLNLPPESQQLLEGISEEYLTKLLAVRTSDEVPQVVRETTKASFEAIVLHFTDQLCKNFEDSESVISTLKTEVNSLQNELRTQHQINESQKVQLVQQGEQEVQALRDQLRAFQVASAGGDEVAAAVNERALEEYTHMLIEARREANHLRQELETERNHCATVCLRLKTSLQKRNTEFENAVVARAEEVVKQSQAKVSGMEAQLAENIRAQKEFSEIAVQAGDPSIVIPSHETFIPNVMSAVKNDSSRRNNPHNKEIFEQEVWRKTQELLSRYGNSNQQ